MARKLDKSKRMTVSIPKGTEIEAFLINNGKFTYWELLEQLVKQLPKSKEERAAILYDRFVDEMTQLYPDIKNKLNYLRPLIIHQIINRNKPDISYYEELKRL